MDWPQVLVKTFSVHIGWETKDGSFLGLSKSYYFVKHYLPDLLASAVLQFGGGGQAPA